MKFDKSMIYQPIDNLTILKKVPSCRFLPYEEMSKITSIDQLLPKTLILYQLDKIGHFCGLMSLNNGNIQFFDPFGLYPDDQLDLVNPKYHHYMKSPMKYLLSLMEKSQRPVVYNEYRLQSRTTSVCGAWVALRLTYPNLTSDEFAQPFLPYKKVMRDMIVSELFWDL